MIAFIVGGGSGTWVAPVALFRIWVMPWEVVKLPACQSLHFDRRQWLVDMVSWVGGWGWCHNRSCYPGLWGDNSTVPSPSPESIKKEPSVWDKLIGTLFCTMHMNNLLKKFPCSKVNQISAQRNVRHESRNMPSRYDILGIIDYRLGEDFAAAAAVSQFVRPCSTIDYCFYQHTLSFLRINLMNCSFLKRYWMR